MTEEDPGEAGDDGADDEGLHLEAHHRLAGDGGHGLVLADRAEHAAERRAPHPLEDEVDEDDRQRDQAQVEEIVVDREPAVERTRDPGDAVGAPGEPGLVQEEEAQGLAEAQRDDGEIVLAQPERRQRQPRAREAADHEGGAPRQRPDDTRDHEQPRGVGADREEGHDAEIHQPREAPLHVEAEGQQRADAHQGGDGGQVADHDRAPARPCGRTRSMMRMIAKPTADL